MAFGLKYDKNKILQAAEKHVLNGKIDAAIEEYEKIYRKDPQDLMTLNTIGDLLMRSGKTADALRTFNELAEKYVEGGFVARGIAVYKRITKIDSPGLPALIRLGELYFMQGLTRDSRMHFLQAVELLLGKGDRGKALEIFEKIVVMDLENPQLQAKLASLYAQTGKAADAVASYLGAAERYLNKGDSQEAEKCLQEAVRLDKNNAEAAILLARVYLQAEKYKKAAEVLESIKGLTEQKEALLLLQEAYAKQGNSTRAEEIAIRLAEQHGEVEGLGRIAERLIDEGNIDEALKLYKGANEKIAGGQINAALLEGLQKIVTARPTQLEALELLWQWRVKAGQDVEAVDVAEALGHAYAEQGQLEKAREVFDALVKQEPSNTGWRQMLRRIESRLQGSSEVVSETSSPAMAIGLEMVLEEIASSAATSAATEQLSPQDQEKVQNCLTESELLVNYRQIGKAIRLLAEGLKEVPGNIALLEQLMALYERENQYQKAAECAEALTEKYVMLGDGDKAARYGDLVLKYQQKALDAGAATEQAAEETGSANAMQWLQEQPGAADQEPTAAAVDEKAGSEAQVREIDLSQDWATLATTGQTAVSESADSAIEEIDFYIQAGLTTDAKESLENLEKKSPGHPAIAELKQRLVELGETFSDEMIAPEVAGSADAPAAAVTEVAFTSALDATITPEAAPQPTIDAYPGLGHAVIQEQQPAEQVEPAAMMAQETPFDLTPPMAAEPQAETAHDDFLHSIESQHSADAFELSLEDNAPSSPLAAASGPAAAASANPLGDLAMELSAGLDFPAAPGASQSVPKAPAAPAPAKGAGFLDDLMSEFKEEMEVPATAAGEDLETHYNMGIAFKEMGLFDEAIGEFQKVHEIAETKKDYSHLVQCCSLLASCFLEKGMPKLAVTWYETALKFPHVEGETSLALLYEVGVAHEMAGEKEAALRSFMEVYARNIDYRNVTDRIRDLQQSK
ncbi:MAG: hypothetical protein A3F68_12585 [Acidobacteria bacterium RIFCSPLOWO2_12_FULL_54_10]|nr:MAG: hypothetical protein A3F68_12585 [Acidobacteria bacterium RIFCSPLOWO2_12_FULL_54_10]